MGVQGLLEYIIGHPSTREKVKLKEFAKAHLERTGKQPELLCDFTSVVQWLLTGYDYALIGSGAESPYCLLYGGLLKNYSNRVLSFVSIIQSLGVKVVFCVQSAPFSADKMELLYGSYSAECSRKVLECGKVLQVCAGNVDMTQVQWAWKEGMVAHLMFVLKSASNIRMMYYDDKVKVISYMQANKHVLGILSSDTSYAVPRGCGLFLLDLFGLDVCLPTAVLPTFEAERDLSCEVVWGTWIASSLDITLPQLADLAILCGNEYTSFLNSKSQPSLALGISGVSVPQIAGWLHDQSTQLGISMKKFVGSHIGYQKAMEVSYQTYSISQEPELDLLEVQPILKDIVTRGGFLSPEMVSVVTSKVYWRPVLLEPETLGSPRFCDVTLLIRRFIYALLGSSRVTEYGYITNSSRPVQIPVTVGCNVGVFALLPLRRNERLSILYHIVTYPGVLDLPGDLEALLLKAVKQGGAIAEDISSSGVLLFSVLVFMRACNQRLSPSPDVFVCELEAFLVTLLCSLAGVPSFGTKLVPPAKAVTLASWFSHLLDQVYWLASCLGLSRDLPPPGELFSTHQYIPIYLASNLCENSQHSPVPSTLQQACALHQEIWELEPILELRAEILQESPPSLSRVVEVFHSSWDAITVCKTVQKLSRDAEEMVTIAELPDGAEFQMHLDEDTISTSESPLSPGMEELSSIQECNATEEDHFFSSQSLGPCERDSCDRYDDEDICSILGSEYGNEEEEEVQERKIAPLDDILLQESEDSARSKNKSSPETKLGPDAQLDAEVGPEAALGPDAEAALGPESLLGPLPVSARANIRCGKAAKMKRKKMKEPELPIMEHRSKILELVRQHTIVCIEGETGCGKSTKVPQFILDDMQSQTPPSFCHIMVTQPRRVAAIKLAERVAGERGEKIGKTVGYCVGGDHHRAAETKLTYCTIGYLLQVSL